MFGGARLEEAPLDEDTILDLLDMYRSSPVIKLARKSFLSMTLSEPFTFSIPAMGIVSNAEMAKIIEAYWMPWLRVVYDWCQLIGICPYYFEDKGDHRIPIVPDIELGYITCIVEEKTHKVRYEWSWDHGTAIEVQKDMLWIITENRPTKDGVIRSPLVSLLPNYRSLLKLQKSQDIVVTQCARPVHVIEFTPNARTANDDNLTHMVADYGKAAGIGKARKEQVNNAVLRAKTAELYRAMQETNKANSMNTTVSATMWTDTDARLMEEMDAGFTNRLIVMRPDMKYGAAEKPTLVQDYYKAESQFNVMAAAIMDFSLELLTPTGSARSQNVEGAERFENERIKEQTSFFEGVLRSALIIAYRDSFVAGMDQARTWRVEKLGGDPNEVAFLFPELDVVIDLSSSTVTGYQELKEMHMDGLITKETMGKHAFKNKNMPLEQMVTLDWPDKVPKELLVGPKKDAAAKPKPKKKKAKPSS